jgi:hypothetical protein
MNQNLKKKRKEIKTKMHISDDTSTLEITSVEEEEPNTLQTLSRIIAEVIKLYELDPEWVKRGVINLRAEIKLNRKIKDRLKNPESRKLLYKGIEFYDVLRKQGKGHVKACEIVCKTYGINEKVMKSVIGSRNGFRSLSIR